MATAPLPPHGLPDITLFGALDANGYHVSMGKALDRSARQRRRIVVSQARANRGRRDQARSGVTGVLVVPAGGVQSVELCDMERVGRTGGAEGNPGGDDNAFSTLREALACGEDAGPFHHACE